MFALALAVVLMPGQEPAKPAEPAPDRSGEKVLKEIMDGMAALRGTELIVTTAARNQKGNAMEVDQIITIYFDGGSRFQVLCSSVWGDGSRWASDGKTLLIDPLDGGSPVTLRDAAATLHESDARLAGQIDPLSYLLGGSKTLEKVVAKDGFIREIDPSGPERGVQFKSATKGTMAFYYLESDKRKLVRRIEFDNKAYLESQYRTYPEWYSLPDDPLTSMSITYGDGRKRLPNWAFSSSPPLGTRVLDQRKKR